MSGETSGSDARSAILGRIRSALQRPPGEPNEALTEAEAHIRARPMGPQPGKAWEPLVRFSERALALSSSVDSVASFADVPAAIARYLAAHNLPMHGVCWPQLGDLNWSGAGLDIAPRAAHGDDLVGITGAFCAVADTGTLVLLSGPESPAATSLLPETHIAVLPLSRIVPFMEDAWTLLRAERGQPPRAVNFVSGPSRTADIEQTVTLGAHGPYRVHIVLIAA